MIIITINYAFLGYLCSPAPGSAPQPWLRFVFTGPRPKFVMWLIGIGCNKLTTTDNCKSNQAKEKKREIN